MTRYNYLGQKIACAKCIRGHRSQTCKESHTEDVRVVHTVGRPSKNSGRAVQASAHAPTPFAAAVPSVGAPSGGFDRLVRPAPTAPSDYLVPSIGVVPSAGHKPSVGLCVSAIHNFDDLMDSFWDESLGCKDVVSSTSSASVNSSPGNENHAGLNCFAPPVRSGFGSFQCQVPSAPVPAPISCSAGPFSPELAPSHWSRQMTRDVTPSQQRSIDAVYSTLSECIIDGLSKVDSGLP
ncbi:hypothetical protein ACHAPJ_012007 [Fusarium lateritium]